MDLKAVSGPEGEIHGPQALRQAQRQDAHVDEVRAVMRSKLVASTARVPSRLAPFAAQSREEPMP